MAAVELDLIREARVEPTPPAPMLPALAAQVESLHRSLAELAARVDTLVAEVDALSDHFAEALGAVRHELALMRRRLPVRVRPPELTAAQIDVLADAVVARLAASFEVVS